MPWLGLSISYRNLLLRDHDGAILSSYTDGGDVGSGDGLEGIFCEETGCQKPGPIKLAREYCTYRLGRDDLGLRRW